jgi:hypothetical protein
MIVHIVFFEFKDENKVKDNFNSGEELCHE